MTDAELQSIRDRCAKATAPPWFGDSESVGDDIDRPLFFVSYAFREHDDPQALADAIFAANARQDVPALLSEVDRLRAALADEREACAQIAGSFAVAAQESDCLDGRDYAACLAIAAAIRARASHSQLE